MRKFYCCVSILLSLSLNASQTQTLIISGNEPLSQGMFEGTALLGNGSITLAPKMQTLSDGLPGSVLTMKMIEPDLYWVSSLSPATILEVKPGQEARTVFTTDRPMFTSIAKFKNGQIAVASAPSGGIYVFKNRSEKEPMFFPVPEVDLILGIATLGSDLYIVGGGAAGGRLLKMSSPKGTVEVLAEIEEAHANSIFIASTNAGPQIYFGGAELGTIYKYSKGKVESIYAGPAAEVTSIVADKNLRVFASFVDSDGHLAQMAPGSTSTPSDMTFRSPMQKDIQSSHIVMLEGQKAPRVIWESRKTGVFSLYYDDSSSQLFAGTGMQSRVLRIDATEQNAADILSQSDEPGEIVALEKDSRGQLVGLSAGLGEISAIDLNAKMQTGHYLSRVIDAGVTARFGSISVNDKGNAGFDDLLWRVGNTPHPDDTWSSFGTNAPLGRYAQFKLEWPKKSKSSTPKEVRQFRVSYLPINQKPTIRETRLLMPNERLQMQEPQPEWSRSVTLDENAFRVPDNRFSFGPQSAGNYSSTLSFAPNYRSVYVWAQDPDFDVLRYRFVLEKLSDNAETKERKLLKDWDIEPFVSFDTAQAGDGHYRVSVDVDDFYSNGPKRALADNMTTATFELTSSLPEFTAMNARVKDAKTELNFTIEAKVPLALVQCSDAKGKWFSVDPEDEITDQKKETFKLVLQFVPKFNTITCQAMDIDQNVRKIDIKVRGS